MHRKVKDFFELNHPSVQSPRVIVGLSGGADSVALLLALRNAGVDCIAAHCNFHLRGDESDRDESFCRDLCLRLGIDLQVRHFDVARRMADSGESTEMACRSLRYDWWRELVEKGEGKLIAVGHHREDNVETFFLNLMRGSGIAGLKGIMPINGVIIRPLLDCTRAEIEGYVRECGFSWITDSSNLHNDYKRNKLRNIVIPVFEQEFPGAIEAVARSITHLRESYGFYMEMMEQKRNIYTAADGSIEVARLYASERHPSIILYELLRHKGFNAAQIDDIAAHFTEHTPTGQSGQHFSTPSGVYVLDRGVISRLPQNEIAEPFVTEDIHALPIDVTTISPDEFNQLKSKGSLDNHTLYLDSKCLNGATEWMMRAWQQGDRIKPFGMKGSRLVSDIYNDLKISATLKQSIPLLFLNGQLLWIAGVRASRLYPVTKETTSIIKINLRHEDSN